MYTAFLCEQMAGASEKLAVTPGGEGGEEEVGARGGGDVAGGHVGLDSGRYDSLYVA
jgi:hypothetical protein